MYRYEHSTEASFTEKLISKIGQSVVLFGRDSISYFGKLVAVQRNDTAVLRPSPLSESGLVELQNPAEVSAVENWSKVDICTLVAFGFDITGDPFVMPNDDAEDMGLEPDESVLFKAPAQPGNGQSNGDSPITITTLGGFLFAGTIDYRSRSTAQLSIDYIFAPGGDGSTLFFINKAIVNLNDSTSVSG